MTDLAAPFRARIEDVRLPANVTAGCNYLVVASLVLMLRGTTEDPEPVVVELEADGSWRVCDGRHRFLAAVIAGRPDVLCRVADAQPADCIPSATR